MQEKFLHFVWKFQLFSRFPLFSVDGKELIILERGSWNEKDSGPDFSMSKVKIDREIWIGNVEIHRKSSDWVLHHHSSDNAYSNVILHVVFEHDKKIDFLENNKIPTLELKNFISKKMLENYTDLLETERKFIPCEHNFPILSQEVIGSWLERLMRERLDRKIDEVEKNFVEAGKNWEKLLFQNLAYAFGLKINAEAFLIWSKSFDFKIVQKLRQDTLGVHALFFGQAGFLEFESNDHYTRELQKKYSFLQSKFKLIPVNPSMFKFFRLRPVGFPTIRLMQLATLYSSYPNLFSFMMGSKSKEKLYPIFQDLQFPEYWSHHFTLDKESSKISEKKISNELMDRIIINVIVPIKFAYAKSLGKEISEELMGLLRQLPAEKNNIIQSFSQLGLKPKNALESQAYLELKKHYCDRKKCLNCSIGLQIVKNV